MMVKMVLEPYDVRVTWYFPLGGTGGGGGLIRILYLGDDPLPSHSCIMMDTEVIDFPIPFLSVSCSLQREEERPSHLLLLGLVKPWPWGPADGW